MTDLARELELILRRAQADRLPSVAAAIARNGEVVWAGAVGLANAEAGEPATPGHQYRIASITKTFTAACVMQLRDEGKLDLDDRLSDHIATATKGPTIRRMLSHLSGVQREPPGRVWETLAFPTGDELVASLAEAEQVLPPNQRFHYSNLAYGLLGELVERLVGTSFENVVRTRILEPLGLLRTTFEATAPVAIGYLVDPYEDVLRREAVTHERGGAAAAGQLWTTATDLCRWGSYLAESDGAVLAPATVEEMCEVQAMEDGGKWNRAYGLGVSLERRGEHVYAGHAGSHLGFLAGLMVRREDRISGAVLTNSGTRLDAPVLAIELIEKVLELEPSPPEEWRPGEPAPEELAGALGRWWTEGEEFVLSWRSGRLEARFAGSPGEPEPAVFERIGPDTYRVASGSERGELLELVRDELGIVVKLYWATYPCTRDFRTLGDAAG
jgi:CubicO group peptidase (beta-lactamase class C family)